MRVNGLGTIRYMIRELTRSLFNTVFVTKFLFCTVIVEFYLWVRPGHVNPPPPPPDPPNQKKKTPSSPQKVVS